ncbi:MAG: carbohydrate ABC transporter permease [Paenibacillaceae bacterium]|nr:carbohydrate ABC transporter permease [Paenibacillaceae bacterium]
MIMPMIHLLAVSLSSPLYAAAKLVGLWPRGFNVRVYESILGSWQMWRSLGVSVYITLMGTLLTLLLCSSLAFSLSRPAMKGRRFLLRGIIVTFIFTIPLIPGYLVVRGLGMENTLWALIVPGAVGAFYIIIMKTFFQGLSPELMDAAKIDGCSEFGNYVRIVLPLSKAVLATIALYHAVGQWNSYFSALIFIRTRTLLPLQIILREFVQQDGAVNMQTSIPELLTASTPEMIKAGAIIFGTLPILVVYPFLQKYFVKGATLGSLKE